MPSFFLTAMASIKAFVAKEEAALGFTATAEGASGGAGSASVAKAVGVKAVEKHAVVGKVPMKAQLLAAHKAGAKIGHEEAAKPVGKAFKAKPAKGHAPAAEKPHPEAAKAHPVAKKK